jgi:hypothetical protein
VKEYHVILLFVHLTPSWSNLRMKVGLQVTEESMKGFSVWLLFFYERKSSALTGRIIEIRGPSVEPSKHIYHDKKNHDVTYKYLPGWNSSVFFSHIRTFQE